MKSFGSSCLLLQPRRLAVAPLALVLALCSACSSSSDQPGPEASDASVEAALDAGSDAVQAEVDAAEPRDAAEDVADARLETGVEAGDGNPQTEADAEQSDGPSDGSPPQLGVISVPELAAALPDKDFLLINVHVPYAGEIPGTDANLTYTDVPAIESFIGPDLGTRVVVYCMSNYMSGIAGNALVADGYWAVRYLDGGLGAWEATGNPVEYHDQ